MNTKQGRGWFSRTLRLALVGTVMLIGSSCGKTREAADTVADEVTGYRVIKQGDGLKSQVRQIDALKSGQLKDVFPDKKQATDE